MKRLTFIAITLAAAATWVGAQIQSPLRVPTGVIATHFSGRFTVAPDSTIQVFGYFPFIDGVGANLFQGDASPRNAHFTFRSVPLRPTVLPVTHLASLITLAPIEGEGFYNVYFQASPSRDLGRPETLEGQLIASFRARSAAVNLLPHSSSVFSATLVLDSASDFSFRGRTYNLRNHVNLLTIHANTEPFPNFELGRDGLTAGYSGHGVSADPQ